MAAFKDSFWGPGGFDELKCYMKQGTEFCKELAAIMQERYELENTYAKGLLKLGLKLSKTTGTCIGSLSSAWGLVAAELETEAETRKNLATSLCDDVYRPIKSLMESQYKQRKPLTGSVDKVLASLLERRTEENKNKKASYQQAKEAEKIQDHINESKLSRAKSFTEKDLTKMDKKMNTLQATLSKCDSDYHDSCLKAETARQDWEQAVYQVSGQLQILEEERVSQLKSYLGKYCSHLKEIPLKLMKACDRLQEAALVVDVQTDLSTVVEQRGTGPNQPVQILFESYAEDFNNKVDQDRRQKSLLNYLLYFKQDLQKEQKGKEGVERLLEVYQNRPNFADPETVESSRQKLLYSNSTMNFLEACHYKLSCAIAKLNEKSKPDHKYSQYIQRATDKQGFAMSTLRLPLHMIHEGVPHYDSSTYRRGAADGGQDTRPVTEFYDDDEFDSYDGETDKSKFKPCRALYDYTAQNDDELTIKENDVLLVYDQGEDGWWRGEHNGAVGLFPATYVEPMT